MIPVRDHNPTFGPVWVVWALVIASLAGFVVPWLTAGDGGLVEAAWRFGSIPAAIRADPGGQALGLVAHAFLHGGWIHLIGNLLFLWVFGDNVEDRLGHARFLVFYLLGVAFAALSHALLTSDPSLPLIGASGAISAVLGAYVRLYPLKRVQAVVVPLLPPWLVLRVLWGAPPFFLWTLPAWAYLGYWAALQVWEGVAAAGVVGGGVAWWAHVGGFVFGVLLVPLFARRPPTSGHLAGSINP
ncbi:MAG: rhomboid family intramembrane serine protease [bacterium]|jgi:membrane associated rhomboid family serine protease|nr:rhomboid family intramembrane serine protease [bacterium]